ncbi:MAG TPA: Crp/Fnr family transcriptional regulator [Flavobacterium sp.]|uniref:Crp/Fnr family transcriptional regulator n=1 Tax=Flavobacterium sp. TaxID=239 RepID=UPI002BFAD1D5|nr:Crp/Fnr family transcriptional regulator [Flavobacterium sp.]HSD14352.1 Crp/Fnr family transcriptional regulator [Flavobacterium sp.]
MQIDLDLLYSWGGITKEYKKNEIIFYENTTARFYYQILEGCVRLFNTNDKGKEFTEAYFWCGDSFGEPPLLIDKDYPASAVALRDCTIIRLPKESFLKILEEYPCIQKHFLDLMADRVHSKIMFSKDIINQKPEFRINAFLKAQKNCDNDEKWLVPYTRQEIANFTGLRVETVIRVFLKMKDANKIELVNHKIYY